MTLKWGWDNNITVTWYKVLNFGEKKQVQKPYCFGKNILHNFFSAVYQSHGVKKLIFFPSSQSSPP